MIPAGYYTCIGGPKHGETIWCNREYFRIISMVENPRFVREDYNIPNIPDMKYGSYKLQIVDEDYDKHTDCWVEKWAFVWQGWE